MTVKTISWRQPRVLGWLGFFTAILGAWIGVYLMARDGSGWICGPDVVFLLPLGGFWTLFAMWSVMMLAMMLPTLVPTLHAYDDLGRVTGAGRAGWLGLIAGYGAVWIIGSAGFAALQVAALRFGLIGLNGAASNLWLAAALFVLAGLWQFTRTKEACQSGCLTPIQYFMANWQPGILGGWRMGVDIGLTCVGCCWAIMMLGFVGGVMSLLWMGLATVFMVAEKLPDIGAHLRRPGGIILLVAGLACVLRAGGVV
ncbi:MAG: DUF2182 domain-containing protein [Marinosulfonomonas sp.]|nr:DUF2182 domain-containing protein [Marinosulfonomonas sp.]